MKRFFITLAVVALLGGCQNDGDDGGQGPRILGEIGAGYVVAHHQSLLDEAYAWLTGGTAHALGDYTVDHIAAVPTVRNAFDKIVEVPIDGDGSFALSLNQGYDWVLLLINSQAPLDQRIVGYVTMGSGADSMMDFPVIDMIEDLSLGQVACQDDVAVSSTDLDAAAPSFTLSVDDLLEIARADDLMRSVINDYRNYDSETGTHYALELGFGWQAPIEALMAHDAIEDAPSDFVFTGYTLGFQTNDPRLTYSALCGETVRATLHPPSDVVTASGVLFNDSAPLSNDDMRMAGTNCQSDQLAVALNGGALNLEFGGGRLLELAPDGFWRFRVDGESRALFDLGITDPNAADHITVPVPIPDLELDADGMIQRIDVAWLVAGAGDGGPGAPVAYRVVTQHQALGRIVNNVSIVFERSGQSSDNVYLSEGNLTEHVPAAPLKFNFASPALGDIIGVGVNYRAAGHQYQFTWGRAANIVARAPDLTISDVIPGGAGGSCLPTHFDVVVQNVGTVAATVEPRRLLTGSPDVSFEDAGAEPTTILPGESLTVRGRFDPSSTVVDGSEVVFTVDPDGLIEEQREDNNAWPYTVLVHPPDPVDLTFGAIVVEALPALGTAVATVTVEVEGNAALCSGARLWTVTTPDGSSASFTVEPGTIVEAGAHSSEVTLTTALASMVGDHELTFVLDPDDVLMETDETNNGATVTMTVQSGPDLRVMEVRPISALGPCPPLGLQVDIVNAGTEVVVLPINDVLTVTPHGQQSTILGATGIVIISPGETVVGSVGLDIPWPFDADVDIAIALDPTLAIAETNEDNNRRSERISVPPPPPAAERPDLVPVSLTFSPNPAQLTDRIFGSFRYRNAGTGPAYFCRSMHMTIGHTVGGDGVGVARGTGSSNIVLMPGEEAGGGSWAAEEGRAAVGSQSITLVLDPGGVIDEADESNNTLTQPLLVQDPSSGIPELEITSATSGGGLGPCPIRYFELSVINRGTGPLLVPVDQLIGSTSPLFTGSDVPGESGLLLIAAGATVTARAGIELSTPVTPGQTITFTVDPMNLLAESDEGNNTWEAPIPLPDPLPAELPDLVLRPVTFSPNPARLTDSVIVTGDVENLGAGPAYFCAGGASTIWTASGPDGGGGARGAGASHIVIMPGAIGGGGTRGIMPGDVPVGTHTFTGQADPNDVVVESNETNNGGTGILTILPAGG